METPISDEAISTFDAFTAQVRSRLDRGRQDYGDSSFDRPLGDVLRELSEEALDIAGWGFIVWARIERLKRTLDRIETLSTVRDTASELGVGEANL